LNYSKNRIRLLAGTDWNLPAPFWQTQPDLLADIDSEEEDRLMAVCDTELEEHYWKPAIMNGAIPICHLGCAFRQWLVINGDQAGFVWNDFRADNRGISPVRDEGGHDMTFRHWYMAWLTDALHKCDSAYGS
jgi:hypothetical protein